MHHSVPALRAASPTPVSLGLYCTPVAPAIWVAEAATSGSRPCTAARPLAHHLEAVAASAATAGPLVRPALRTSSALWPWSFSDTTAARPNLPWRHAVCTHAILSNHQLTSSSSDAVAPHLPGELDLAVPASSSVLQLPAIASLKVLELQAALRSLGLPISGRKAELIERLAAAQRPAAAASSSAVQLAEDASVSTQRSVISAARKRARNRTVGVNDGVEPASTSEDGVVDITTEISPAGGAVRRRRSATQRDPGGEVQSVGAEDSLLDELFSTMDLNISVETRDPREILAAGSTITPTPASARMGGGAANCIEEAVAAGVGKGDQRRRRVASAAAGMTAAAAAAAAPREDIALDGSGTDPGPSGTAAATAARKGVENDRSGEADMAAAARSSRLSTPPYTSGLAPPSNPRDTDLDPDVGHDYDLPPWPPMFMGEMRSVDELAPGDRDAQEELLLANVSGMSLTVLGSAAVRPTATRALASLAMARVKDIFIFDAGDDTQRQVAHAYHVKPSKIYRIFLTSLEPESVLGLPGLMCIINSSRERGHEIADIPVHVYGPPGTADFLGAMMRVSHTCLEVTIVVHEISTDPVAPAESQPYLYVKRARIWRVMMPPDQLNPRGGVDASLLLFAPDQGRSQKKRGRNSSGGVLSFDPRAGFLPFPPLEPGNPYKRDVDPKSMTWTLELDITARVIINMLPGVRGPVLSYTVQEADRAGALVVERATAAGLMGGPDFAKLKAGETVKNSWGLPVPPSLVISPNRPGRRVVILGNTTDPSALARDGHLRHVEGADVLVAGAVWPKDDADLAAAEGGCTTDQLGEAAWRLGARYVLLSRYDGQKLNEQDGYAARMADELAVAAAAAAAAAADPASVRSARAKHGTAARGQRSISEWRRRVVAVADLESVLVEKNEGPKERSRDGHSPLLG